jgi:hypothetical protein
MRRREFVALLGGAAAGPSNLWPIPLAEQQSLSGAAAGWPSAAWAQRSKMPLLGFLGGADPFGYASQIEAGYTQQRS